MIKNWFRIVSVLLLMMSCSSEDDPQPNPSIPEETAPLTILSYLVANNNLDDDLYENIAAMCQGLSLMEKPASLLVYWDGKTSMGANAATHAILKFETDGKGNVNGLPPFDEFASAEDMVAAAEIVKEYSNQISTSENVMSTVLKDMVSLAPTTRLGLVFGSHGSAWTNTIFTSRSFGQDGSYTDNTILLTEMVSAIKSTGRNFDFLLFDACYMGTVEVCYDFKDVTDYQLLSVMEVPAYGFPYYTKLLSHLYEGTVQGYTKACQSYIDYYNEIYTSGKQAWGTVALVDSKEVSNLTAAIKEEIISHKELLATFDTEGIQEYGKTTGPDIAIDLRHFVKEMNEGTVPTTFDAQLNKTVLYKGCLTTARPASYTVDAENYCGLGIYVPVEYRTKWNDYFKTIDWFTVSGWNEVTFSWDF